MDTGIFAGTMILTLVIVAVSVLVSIAVPVAIIVFIMKKNAERNRLVATGMPGQALIVQIADTGMRINDQPRLQIVVDVHPMPGHPPFAPFRTTHTGTVPMMAMARVAPGATVPVKCDPANPANLTIDWAAMGYFV
ncbi:MAG: hypothetical protein M5U28_36800 [Sandaracinaceae bacterium]|nr:hypothetical protein [Sandaracinaceae bacterium]